DDKNADIHNVQGASLKALGALDDAGYHFGRAIELKPDHADAHNNLGGVLVSLKRFDEAEQLFRRAISLKPDFALAYYHLANVLRDLDRTKEAQAALETALRHDPKLTPARITLGHIMTDQGELAEAEEHYRAVLSGEPANGSVHYHLAFVKKFAADDPDLAAITGTLERSDLTVTDRLHLNYAAGKALADIGDDHDQAFIHLAEGARLRRSQLDYEVTREEGDFFRVEKFFTREVFAQHAGKGDPSSRPIFIVGMPRSGTTLVEQVLASHSAVHAVGERKDLANLCKSIDQSMDRQFPDWIDDLQPEQFAEYGRAYVESIAAGAPQAGRITDKMLTNFKLLGFIALILPNAKVVHVRRHPLDACLSCFSQPFTEGSHYSYDLAELGRYYKAYHRLMSHWKKVLPDGLLTTLDYEDVVADTEGSARRLIGHCGLEWEAGCLDFQKTKRAVKTASAAQVREKVYSSSVGRWRNYEKHLAPLIEALGPLSQGHAPSAITKH
ncbi:MAG: sulfotransferase, partial [Aestuariivirgaceae bacterium]